MNRPRRISLREENEALKTALNMMILLLRKHPSFRNIEPVLVLEEKAGNVQKVNVLHTAEKVLRALEIIEEIELREPHSNRTRH